MSQDVKVLSSGEQPTGGGTGQGPEALHSGPHSWPGQSPEPLPVSWPAFGSSFCRLQPGMSTLSLQNGTPITA